jgi:hypothetical protein
VGIEGEAAAWVERAALSQGTTSSGPQGESVASLWRCKFAAAQAPDEV